MQPSFPLWSVAVEGFLGQCFCSHATLAAAAHVFDKCVGHTQVVLTATRTVVVLFLNLVGMSSTGHVWRVYGHETREANDLQQQRRHLTRPSTQQQHV